MERAKSNFEKYVFVCENERETGDCCGKAGTEIREKLKHEVKSRKLADRIRVSRAGCLDVCSDGPNVLIEPDDIWLKHVSEEDIPKILDIVISLLKPAANRTPQ